MEKEYFIQNQVLNLKEIGKKIMLKKDMLNLKMKIKFILKM